jgi:amino ABC transporter, permease protein, 3-TM region, his/glu/gln/arg/opine family
LANKLKDDYKFTVVTFKDSANMYEDVLTGNSDATIEDAPVIAYAIKNGNLRLKLIGEKLETSQTGFAVKKGKNADLLAAFNRGLASLKSSGKYQSILDKYIGEDAEASTQNSFFGQLAENGPALLSGLGTTLWIAFISVALALILGIILGLLRVQANPWLSGIAAVYVDLMRGVPLIVLSFFIYFGIPQMTGVRFSSAAAGIMTLSLNAAAYVAEIVRGGIQAIDKGQMEASRSLGLSYGKTMQKIILPQAIKLMIPSFINQFVITLKDTSILSVIGLVELTQTGSVIIARTYQSGSMWLIVGLIYLIVITALTRLSKRLEGGK